MPPYPGEERVMTVFADIHYYFTAPTPRPLHHRFDKGSYFYIYYNSTRRTSRIEVANNPGTPDQDAFNGYLDRVKLRWSFKFPTLLTFEVDAADATPSPGGQSPQAKDPNEWRLSSADPRDQGKYMYRLHTLDVYFWTYEDARLVVDTTKRLLAPHQLAYLENPAATSHPHQESISPVVQQLENVAISDPAYHNGQTRNSQNQASQIPPPSTGPPAFAQSTTFHGPDSPNSSKQVESPVNFTPMAYNPAAPPAPEPIAHREKTPPPPDAAEGTGLAQAAALDHAHGLASPSQPYTGVSGQPPIQAAQPSTPWGQPPAPGQGFTGVASSLPGHPTLQLQHSTSVSSAGSGHPQPLSGPFSPPPVDPNAHLYAATQSPMQSPEVQILGSAASHQPYQPLQHLQPQYADYLSSRPVQPPPPGGYSQYSYDQNQHAGNPYDVHHQVYRPTESEAQSHIKPSSGGQKTGKLEERTDRVEKRVNSFLKKLEKRM